MAAPPPVLISSEADLRCVREAAGASAKWQVVNLETGEKEICVLDTRLRRSIRIHGLTASGDIFADGATAARLKGVKVHFCSHWPCGHRYDNRIEPYAWHGQAVAPVLADPAATAAVADSVAAAPASQEAPDGKPILEQPPPAELEQAPCAPAEEAAVEVGEDEEIGRGNGSPAEEAVVLIVEGPDIEHAMRRVGDLPRAPAEGDAERLRALRAIFVTEVQKWRMPFFWLPGFALLAYAVAQGRRFQVVMGGERIDWISLFSPDLAVFLPDGADAFVAGAVVLRGDPATGKRALHWPSTEEEVLRANHFVILQDMPDDWCAAPHAPCDGSLCGGKGEPCCGALLEALRPLGLAPLPTASDGNCGVDVCCQWMGRPRASGAWMEMRDELASLCMSFADEDLWLRAFDAAFVPTPEELQSAIAAASAEDPDPRASGDIPMSTGAEFQEPPACPVDPSLEASAPSLEAASSGHAADSEKEAVSAVWWALGGGIEFSPIATDAVRGMSEEAKAAWVKAWKADMGQKGSAAPEKNRGTKRRRASKPTGSPTPTPTATSTTSGKSARRRNRQFNVRETLKVLACYKGLPKEKSKHAYGGFRDFLNKQGVAKDEHTRKHYERVWRMCRRRGLRQVQMAAMPRGPKKTRQRLLGRQGAQHVKGRGLKEALFSWFCMIRGAIAGRLPLDVLRAKAEELRKDYIVEALEKNVKPEVPKLVNSGWLSKFMKKYRICLRRPNKRWKCPRKLLLSRLRTMWLNSIRVRTLCWLQHGYDPRASGFDQKPFHINESGSKEAKTLAHKNQREVALKELHTDTRARWTACTMVVSDPGEARAVPHLECLFKGGSTICRRLEADVAAFAPAKLSVTTSDTGSYRMEHVLNYLDKALARQPGEAFQWRLLFCDVYAAHLGDPVSRLAWKHGYVIVVHGGGTTGVAQVNDTHLHQALSREYQRLEQKDMFAQLARDSSKCPTRQRELCMRDLWLIWQRESIHLQAAEGHLRNMLTNSLDGKQDHMASAEISKFWRELHMDELRKECIDSVCEEWEAGRLEWSYEVVYGLIEEHPKAGILDEYCEGQEDEGEDPGDAEPWDDDDSRASGDEKREPGACDSRAPAEEMDFTSAQAAEIAKHERRLSILDSTAEVATGEFPSLVRHALDLRDEVVKQSCLRSGVDMVVARAVRDRERLRADAAVQDKERADARAMKQRAEEAAMEAALVHFEQRSEEVAKREREAMEDAARQRASAEAEARKKAIAEATVGFDLGELGQGREKGGGAGFAQKRFDLLGRVFRLGDEMPPDTAANWKHWRSKFDWRGCHEHGRAWAHVLTEMMRGVLKDMQDGDRAACLKWQKRMTRKWHLDSPDIVVPGSLDA